MTSYFGGFWIVPALLGWTLLHIAFVWAGALVYSAGHGTCAAPLGAANAREGLLRAPIVFDVTYGFTFLLTTLYYYSIPGLSAQHLAPSAAGRIVDFRLLPDIIRIPYFIALLSSLWSAIPHPSQSRRRANSWQEAEPDISHVCRPAADATRRKASEKAFLLLLVTCSSMNALLAGFLLCAIPEIRSAGAMSYLLRGAEFALTGILGGVAGMLLYWKSPWSPFRARTPFSMTHFAVICASAWVWAPAAAILSEQLSPAFAAVATSGAFLLIIGLRRARPFLLSTPADDESFYIRRGLFANTVQSPAFEPHAMLIAFSLYAGCAALACKANWLAAVLLSVCAGLLALRWPVGDCDDDVAQNRIERGSILRFASSALAAMLVTAWALAGDQQHREYRAETGRTDVTEQNGEAVSKSGFPFSDRAAGYQSVILQPPPENVTSISIPFPTGALLSAASTIPVTVRFTGFYTYVQSPRDEVGLHPHLAYGTPLTERLASENFLPVRMHAHQVLSAPVRTKDCQRVDLEIANLEEMEEPISMRVQLRGPAGDRGPVLNLGQKPILSTRAGDPRPRTTPRFERLSYPVPVEGRLKSFSEVEVEFLVGAKHSSVAPRVAIQSLILIPR